MQQKPKPSPHAAGLRRCAEERLGEQHPEAGPGRTDDETRRLVHELQVHQIELEMQNEELQRARDEMEAGLERYSDLYDFAPVGYLTLDRDGTIREANLAIASLLGIDRSRLVKRRLGFYVSGATLSAFTAFLTKVFEGKSREFCEVSLLKDGKIPVEVRIEAAVAASGRECRVVLMDITAQKRAEQDRLILNKLECTGILAGGLAHDFNNLLAAIVLNLDLAQGACTSAKELAQFLEGAKQAAMRASGLTKQLITFASGGAPVRKLTRLSEVIQETTRATLSGSRIECDLSLADDLWLAEVDEGQIGQVIRSVVLNAREAMPQGGVVSVRAENVVPGSHEQPSLPPGDWIQVSIADQGGGIAKEVLPKIFDPYFSTKERGDRKGMGLGLTVCHSIIEKHGGLITVESEEGVGTTFRIHLPASRSVPGGKTAFVPTVVPRHGRILVMDDEDGVRKVLGAALERMGHEVALVEDGDMAIEVYGRAESEGRPFDAVILDLTIRGGMGGQETIQALGKMDSAVKAIVMSGYDDDPVVMAPERHGFKGFLPKPFGAECLRQVLALVMGTGPGQGTLP